MPLRLCITPVVVPTVQVEVTLANVPLSCSGIRDARTCAHATDELELAPQLFNCTWLAAAKGISVSVGPVSAYATSAPDAGHGAAAEAHVRCPLPSVTQLTTDFKYVPARHLARGGGGNYCAHSARPRVAKTGCARALRECHTDPRPSVLPSPVSFPASLTHLLPSPPPCFGAAGCSSPTAIRTTL